MTIFKMKANGKIFAAVECERQAALLLLDFLAPHIVTITFQGKTIWGKRDALIYDRVWLERKLADRSGPIIWGADRWEKMRESTLSNIR
jgi:hypothetical protein